MSVAMLEGRRLHTKATATPWAGELTDKQILRDAIQGSERLRDAILLAKGIVPPKNRPLPLAKVRETAQLPKACPYCGAPEKPAGVLVKHIQHTVASYYGFHPDLMVSAQRRQSISHPRQIAMYLASELTPKSLPEIGRRFGNRDHTTVIYAIRAVKARMESDAEVLLDVEVLRERLAG
jgi:hypothetical protein